MTSQSQEILETCTSGDIVALQRQFEANNIQNSDPVYRGSSSGPPPVNSMLAAAITHGHANVVSLVLQSYSGRKVQYTSETIEALLHHPNIDILQILYDHDPYVMSFEWDGHTDTFVTKACEQPPKEITPLLLWLIEHDADLEGGHFPRTLCNATSGNQELDVIEAMMDKGARVSTLVIRQAVVCERVDVIDLLVSRDFKADAEDAAYLRSEADQTGNEEVVEEVVEAVKKWTSDKSCVVS